MIFPEKCSPGKINLKQLLVIKTLESVKSLPCTSPCYTVGMVFRNVDEQVHYVDTSPRHTHTRAYMHASYCRITNACYTEGTFILVDLRVSF